MDFCIYMHTLYVNVCVSKLFSTCSPIPVNELTLVIVVLVEPLPAIVAIVVSLAGAHAMDPLRHVSIGLIVGM